MESTKQGTQITLIVLLKYEYRIIYLPSHTCLQRIFVVQMAIGTLINKTI